MNLKIPPIVNALEFGFLLFGKITQSQHDPAI
jgi:hypothetical protein